MIANYNDTLRTVRIKTSGQSQMAKLQQLEAQRNFVLASHNSHVKGWKMGSRALRTGLQVPNTQARGRMADTNTQATIFVPQYRDGVSYL